MTGTLYLRKEYFGGIVYEPRAARYFHIGPAHVDAIAALGDGPHPRRAAPLLPFYRDAGASDDETRLSRIAPLADARQGLSAPLKVFFNITKRCNLFCAHCYNDSGHSDSAELDGDTVRRVIATLGRRGIFKVTLAGGEPLYHPEVDAILADLATTDLAVSIVTNGICVSDRRAELLADNASIRSITVSLDGASPRQNDAIRGPQSFSRAVTGIRRLVRTFKGALALRITLTRGTLADMAAYADLAADLGIGDIKVNPVNPYGRAQEQPDLMITAAEYATARDLLHRAATARGLTVEIPAHQYNKDESGQIGLCRAGEETCEIDGDGTLYPCSFTFGRLAAGNLRDEPHDAVFDRLRGHTINNDWCYQCKGRGGTKERGFGPVPGLVAFVPAPSGLTATA